MKYMYAGSMMETRYNIGDTVSGDKVNESRDYRVTDIHIDRDTGGVGYDLEEIMPLAHILFVDEHEIN